MVRHHLSRTASAWHSAYRTTLRYFVGPPAVALIPALSLSAFWFGGEGALLVMAALVPAAYLATGGLLGHGSMPQLNANSPLSEDAFATRCHHVFSDAVDRGENACLYAIEIDEFQGLVDRFGVGAAEEIVRQMAERLSEVVRDDDALGQLGDAGFSVCTGPVRQLSLELCIQMAGRLQSAAERPFMVDGLVIYVDVCVGFCQSTRAPEKQGKKWLEAARIALQTAQAHGASSVRAYSSQLHHPQQSHQRLNDDIVTALDSGAISPWFQPQLCTDTGRIAGFEALARWTHPIRGVLAPSEFLPALKDQNLLERLAEIMMYHSFRALKEWDASGLHVPQVGVNFTSSELSNPRLPDKIKWDLDRFELAPKRLAIEVLETVIAGAPDDVICRNINTLGNLGCPIDLDDFGTGHASIGAIRRFSVSRIKIDRSFVSKADRDPEQQRMISAILHMAERLDVATLAEGVETVGEHVLLAQLGCSHVQGFGICRPLPFDQTAAWISGHNAKLQEMPKIVQSR